MNFIKKLTAMNIMGKSFSHQLAQVTVVSGANFSGKTTRINAIRLALTGAVQGVARKAGEVYRAVASGNPLVADCEFVHPIDCQATRTSMSRTQRSFKMKANGISVESKVEGFENFPAVMFDHEEYFSLSGPDRTRFLFSIAKLPESMTESNIRQTIVSGVKNIKLDEHNLSAENSIADFIQWFDGLVIADDGVQNFVEVVVDRFNERKNNAVANAQRLEKTVQGLTQIEITDTVPADTEQKLMEIKAQIKVAQHNAALVAADHTVCQEEWRVAKAKADTLGTTDFAALEQEAKSLQICLAAFVVPDAPENLEKLRQEYNEALTITRGAGGVVSGGTERVAAIEKEIKDTKAEKTCSKCGQSIEKLKTKVVSQLETELKLAKINLKVWTKDYNAKTKISDKLFGQVKDADSQAESRRTALSEKAKKQGRLVTVTQILSDKAVANDAANRLESIKTRGAELGQQLEQMKLQRKDLERQEQELNNKFVSLQSQRANESQRATALERCKLAQIDAQVAKQAVSLVLQLQKELVKAAVEPIIGLANELCGCLLLASLQYRDEEIVFAGKPWTHVTMSGTEKTIVYAALSVALAQSSPIKLVLMDEFDIDAHNWTRLCNHMCSLVQSGTIDQAIMAHTTGPGGLDESFQPLFLEIEL